MPQRIDDNFDVTFRDNEFSIDNIPEIKDQPNPYESETLPIEYAEDEESVRVISFTIPGVPVSGSQLQFNRKTGNAYRPEQHHIRKQDVYNAACDAVSEAMRPYFRKGVPTVLGVRFFFPYRTTDYGTGRNEGVLKPNVPTFYIGNKDLDNLLKPLKDGLKGVVVNDDKQIVGYSEHWKLYSESPRTEVIIKEIK